MATPFSMPSFPAGYNSFSAGSIGGFGGYGSPQRLPTNYPNLSGVGTVPQASFPSWFNQQAPTQPLQNFQNQLPNYFNLGPMSKTFNASNTAALNSARSASAAAATAQANRAMQSGGSPLGTGFAQGQANQNAFNNFLGNKLRFQQMASGLRAQEAGLAGNVASQMSNLGEAHQGLMANYAQGQQGLGLQGQGLMLNQQGLAQQAGQFNNQFGLQYAQWLRALQGGGTGGFQGQMTYAPNSGQMQLSPQFQSYLNANGVRGVQAPQYPQTAGIGASGDLANYQRQLAQLGSLSTGQPWWNQMSIAGPQGGYNSTNITGSTPTYNTGGGINYGTQNGTVPQYYTQGGAYTANQLGM